MLASSLGSAAEMVRPGTCQDAGQKYVFKKKVHRGSGGLALLCGKYYITYPTFRKKENHIHIQSAAWEGAVSSQESFEQIRCTI